MKRFTSPLIIGVLLALTTMGNTSLCDVVENPDNCVLVFDVNMAPGSEQRMTVGFPVLSAGSGTGGTLSQSSEVYTLILCEPRPHGVYVRNEVDDIESRAIIVAESDAPPGVYMVPIRYEQVDLETDFVEACFDTFQLTIAGVPIDACFYVQAEFVEAGVPVTLATHCSSGSIFWHRWWFDYNGDPESPPDEETVFDTVEHTFSAGTHTVRLEVTDVNETASDDYILEITAR